MTAALGSPVCAYSYTTAFNQPPSDDVAAWNCGLPATHHIIWFARSPDGVYVDGTALLCVGHVNVLAASWRDRVAHAAHVLSVDCFENTAVYVPSLNICISVI